MRTSVRPLPAFRIKKASLPVNRKAFSKEKTAFEKNISLEKGIIHTRTKKYRRRKP